MTDISTAGEVSLPTDPLPSVADITTTFFGGQLAENIGPYVSGQRVGIRWTDEASLRKGVAEIAWAYGWRVEEEVVVPGWGRIDLILHDAGTGFTRIVELKLDLTKPAKVRRAFQQADGYDRWWAANRRTTCSTYLVSPNGEPGLLASTGHLYPAVGHLDLSTFLGLLAVWGARLARHAAAVERLESLHAQVRLQQAAVARLISQPP